MKKSDPNSPPTLRDICLDEIGAIAARIAKASITPMTREQSVALAARTPEGRSAYAWYRVPGSELPVSAAITQIVKSQLAKAEGGAGSMRAAIIQKRAEVAKASPLPSMAGARKDTAQPVVTRPPASAITITDPAQAIYAGLHAAALAAFPGIQESAAVAAFLATPAGQEMHRRYNDAMAAKQAGR